MIDREADQDRVALETIVACPYGFGGRMPLSLRRRCLVALSETGDSWLMIRFMTLFGTSGSRDWTPIVARRVRHLGNLGRTLSMDGWRIPRRKK